jgi:hypothetical protein
LLSSFALLGWCRIRHCRRTIENLNQVLLLVCLRGCLRLASMLLIRRAQQTSQAYEERSKALEGDIPIRA